MLGSAPQPAVPPGLGHRPGGAARPGHHAERGRAAGRFAASGPSGRETWPPWPGTALTLMGERPATRSLRPMPAWGPGQRAPVHQQQRPDSRSGVSGRRRAAEPGATPLRSVYAFSFAGVGQQPVAVVGRSGRCGRLVDGRPRSPARLRAAFAAPVRPGPGGYCHHQCRTPGLRAVTHGEVIAAWARLERPGQKTLVRRAQENPLFIGVDVGQSRRLLPGRARALSLSAATAALAQTSTVTFARIRMAHEPDQSGQPAFLAGPPEGSSGTMMIEYVAASTIDGDQDAADPASIGTLALSRGTEEDAPFTGAESRATAASRRRPADPARLRARGRRPAAASGRPDCRSATPTRADVSGGGEAAGRADRPRPARRSRTGRQLADRVYHLDPT